MLRGVNYYRVKTKHLFQTAEKLTKDSHIAPLTRGVKNQIKNGGLDIYGEDIKILLKDLMN